MRFLGLTMVILCTLICIGQEEGSPTGSTSASFPGGKDSLNKFIAETATIPNRALQNGIGGEVTLTFTIDTLGNTYNIELLNIRYWPNFHKFTSQRKKNKILMDLESKRDDYGLVKSAKDVLRKSPSWIPATKDNKPVEMSFKFPIKFYKF